MRMRERERDREREREKKNTQCERKILRKLEKYLAKERQAGIKPYDWVGLWRIDWEEAFLNSTDSR